MTRNERGRLGRLAAMENRREKLFGRLLDAAVVEDRTSRKRLMTAMYEAYRLGCGTRNMRHQRRRTT